MFNWQQLNLDRLTYQISNNDIKGGNMQKYEASKTLGIQYEMSKIRQPSCGICNWKHSYHGDVSIGYIMYTKGSNFNFVNGDITL